MRDDICQKITRRKFIEKTAELGAVIALAGAGPLPGCSGKSSDLQYDLIIKNGTIYDGTFTPPYTADIGVANGKIKDIGTLTGKALKIINAEALIVCPGFIDVHTHCDLAFKRSGIRRYLSYVMPSWKGNYNYLYQGVTTVVTGNCGYGYTDTEKWRAIVNSVGFGSNVYHLAPHGMIREDLFGKEQPRVLSVKQLEAMKSRVAEEMEKGAVGLSTGLEYAPGLLAPTSELIELSKVVRKYGGLYVSHVRDLTGRNFQNGKTGVVEALKEAIEIGRRAEISVQISHLIIKEPINNTRASQVLDLIEEARLEGLDVLADQHPYDAGSTLLTDIIPNEFKASLGVKEEFKTTSGRLEIKKAIEHVYTYLGPEKILVSACPANDSFEGKTIKEISDLEGKDPADCYVELVSADVVPLAIFFFLDMNIVKDIMPHDYIITASDGWTIPKGITKPHPRVYGTFSKKLRKFVLDEKLMSLSAAIRSMTSLPAGKFKIKGRGKIAEGNFADIAIINPETICDHATYKNPHQYSEGVVHLLVNGKLSIENGIATGDRGGVA